MARIVGGWDMPLRANRPVPQPVEEEGGRRLRSFKRGGRVKKTGTYRLHKGERVMRGKRK